MDLVDLAHKERVVMLTSRGCAYDCAFCYTPKASGKKVRFYSIERIVDEMQYLKSKGIRAFWFADPNFSFSRKRLQTLLEAIIRKVPDITFWCQTRYDLVDRELLSLLKGAGADNLAYGLESANPGVLKRIHKGIDLKRLSEVIRLTQEAGIQVELFSMFGLPGETFGQALHTLSFVKENDVAIEGNSISQQAHLFFGTPMNDDPESFGLRPFPWTRPAYLSVCRDYETDTMSADEIKRISLIWRLHRNDFTEDIQSGRNLFHRASFLTQNQHALAQRPEALCLMAQIYLSLEEYTAALNCMETLNAAFPQAPEAKELLKGPFLCFKVTHERSRFGFRVLYDCHGSVGGTPVPATCGRFQETILGQGMLLPAFERKLAGMAQGETRDFDITFPQDYGLPELGGKTVTFRVDVHHVLQPVTVKRHEDLDGGISANEYALADTQGLQQHNINLYYKVLSRALRQGWKPPIPDTLMLMNLFLTLGFVDRATALMEDLPQNPVALSHGAHIFRVNGQAQKTLEILDRAGTDGPRAPLIRAQALFDLDRLEEAEALLRGMKKVNDVQLAGLQVEIASRLCLPMGTLLERKEDLLDAKMQVLLQTRP
jgi:hypothetical protein